LEAVLSKFTRLELELSLNEILGNNHKLHAKLKSVKQALTTKNLEYDIILKDNATLIEKIMNLEKEKI
jgi:CYTH domain-containing protein